MSKTKHTPGPWEVDWSLKNAYPEKYAQMPRDIGVRGQFEDDNPDGFILAKVISWARHNQQEVEANARLIAAAPDLLAACEKARQMINNAIELGYLQMPDPDCGDPASEVPDMLWAAITKAKGKL